MIRPYPETYRTQKARGFCLLARGFTPQTRYEAPHYAPGHLCEESSVYPHDPVPQALGSRFIFARPCPTVPRHGFVESREVYTEGDVQRVIDETLAQDPQGEVIFMPRLSGAWSGILNHAGVTCGRDHDGATGGKGALTIPAWVPHDHFERVVGLPCDKAGIKQTSYFEFVEHRGLPAYVQWRDGPPIPRGRNYIPKQTFVREIVTVEPGTDLLDWERRIAALYPNGVVVYHPGGALSSHYAVHAIVRGIPVMIDRRPEIGERLRPENAVPPLTDEQYQQLARYLARRLCKGYSRYISDEQRNVVYHAVATLHASPMWGGDGHLLRLRAEGFAGALIYSAAACIGEDRYWYSSGPGRVDDDDDGNNDERRRTDRAPAADGPRPHLSCWDALAISIAETPARDVVYAATLHQPAAQLHQWVREAEQDFRAEGWCGNFGGMSWARAAKQVCRGFKAAERFIRQPSAETWRDCMDRYNDVIHACHNNGRVLGKWGMTSRLMDRIALVPGPAFANSFTVQCALGMEPLLEIETPLGDVRVTSQAARKEAA